MDVTPIVLRLRGQLNGYVTIAASADIDAAIDAAPAAPAVYVVPLAETADDNELIGVHHQRLVQEFAVVLMVSNLRDPTGTAAAAELAAKRLALRAALLGWLPDASYSAAVSFVGGALLQFRDQRLWWRDVFRTTTEYRSV